jgi:hypothetical protein
MLSINIKAAAARAVFMVILRELRHSVDQRPRSMITGTRIHKRTSLPRTNSLARQPRAIDTRLYNQQYQHDDHTNF